MKSSNRMTASVWVLFVALSMPASLAAQNSPEKPHQARHYKLVDLGTFGGPQSYFDNASGYEVLGVASILNNKGIVAGFADTSVSDPFPNYCFLDCYVSHSFLAGNDGTLEDLGALGGGGSSATNWITDNGLVAGVSENGEIDPLYAGLPQLRAVLWQNGRIKNLGTLPEGGYQSQANSVNSAGQVVGSALNTTPDANTMQSSNFWLWGGITPAYQYQTRAFVWDSEHGMKDLGTLPGGTDAMALLINERGQVVGFSYTGSTPSPACAFPLATDSFVWERGKAMVDLGGFGGTCTLATNLNQRGQVVGASNLTGDQSASAFLWENGKIRPLRGSLGGSFTGAFALNEEGQAAGYGYLSGDATYHATLWKRVDQITDLGVVGDDQCSFAAVMNARGQVAGSSFPVCNSDSYRAVLWEDGAIFDLNTLIPPGSALYLSSIYVINDRGEMAGEGVDAGDNGHAFLLIPCDENHPGVEGCDYSQVDDAAALQSPEPGSPLPLSPRYGIPLPMINHIRHALGPARTEAGDSTARTASAFGLDSIDQSEIDAALGTSSRGGRPDSQSPEPSGCPKPECSARHTKGTECGGTLCQIGHAGAFISAFDETYGRKCHYLICF